uniref:Uncharacterized protein n=1 Tax=Ananas comosus var. bracteatus TaxID=296719 RepID=A0A6V7Q9C4_ANACO|nr:unnamed protein product [Ananas comosus var. bracteatus]
MREGEGKLRSPTSNGDPPHPFSTLLSSSARRLPAPGRAVAAATPRAPITPRYPSPTGFLLSRAVKYATHTATVEPLPPKVAAAGVGPSGNLSRGLKLRGESNFNPTWFKAWVGASLEIALEGIWRPFELCLRISSPRRLVGTFVGAHEGFREVTVDRFYACLPLCSFSHACEGRSLQAGTPEIAIATYVRPCGIRRRSGLPWGRLVPRVEMLTTTEPLGMAQARQPTVIAHWELLFNSSHAPVSMFSFQKLRHRRKHRIAARESHS